MSKYISEGYASCLPFTDSDWEIFLNMIQIDCHLKGSSGPPEYKKISLDDIKIRYYDKGEIRYYHVSNDDRRKIVKYLRSTKVI